MSSSPPADSTPAQGAGPGHPAPAGAVAGRSSPPAVRVRALHKSFGSVVALDGVDFEVAPGTLAAVLGPSGCGKTTLLRVVAGFERPDGGEVSIDGRPVAGRGVNVAPERRRVGIVAQEHALFPHMTVEANVAYGLRRRGDRRARVDEMLARCGLGGLGDRMPHELSGGQQQRVALARALAPAPSVVLLDEPFASLDATMRADVRAEVASILRVAEATAVLVTHDQEEALSLADHVAVMRDGRVLQQASPEELYRRPAELWLAGFVGDANVLPAELGGDGYLTCGLGRLLATGPAAASGGGPVTAMIRPEQLAVVGGDRGVGVAVLHREYYGHDALLRVALPDGAELLVRTGTGALARIGEQIRVECTGAVRCYPA